MAPYSATRPPNPATLSSPGPAEAANSTRITQSPTEINPYPPTVLDDTVNADPRPLPIRHAVEDRAFAASLPDVTLDCIADVTTVSPPHSPVAPSSPTPASVGSSSSSSSSSPPTIFSFFGASSSIPSSSRASRRDTYLQSLFWPSGLESSLRRILSGTVHCPVLPPFAFIMASLRRKSGVPSTPRVISPSPPLSDHDAPDYVAPVTRSTAKRQASRPQPVEELTDEENYNGTTHRRSRTRSRSPLKNRSIPRMTKRRPSEAITIPEAEAEEVVNGKSKVAQRKPSNGHLAPPQSAGWQSAGWNWRDFSRSPSPLGLIPIHRHWRTFVHKHEVPRKVLHVSIGFFVIWLYVSRVQTSAVAPYLMATLIPIAATDWLRHRYASFNAFYVRVLGALMRESEYAGWNGVIFYLLGAWIVLYFFPKDVAVVSILLLSWCDTAASTFGRLWGRYTPRIRRGKSLAGSLAALLVGVATSFFFYGWLVPTYGPMPGDDDFMFKGVLSLPAALSNAVGLSQPSITGGLALGVVSLCSGLVASASEVVDVFGLDDNLTIPVLSGIGMWCFFKLCT